MDYPANFARVDRRVMRGARPSLIQAHNLAMIGVRTVINLEWEQNDDALFAGLEINLVRIKDFEPLPWFAPSLALEHVNRALDAIAVGPAISYVHCRSGQNRTGVVIAAYRIRILKEPMQFVLKDFASYRGLWAWGDKRFIELFVK